MELTIIKQNGGVYIDSREVAEIIGKRHKDLLRDIRKYDEIIARFTGRNFTPSDFFVKSSYFDSTGRVLPCYLITRRGADVIANKLSGEKGVLFTAAYVAKFHEMSEREHASEIAKIKADSKPRLGEFNGAVRNVLGGMSYCCAEPNRVMDFLYGVYEPLGIEIVPAGDASGYLSATEIARRLGIYSETCKPHGHAVSAIISKLGNWERHAVAVPYGLVGVTVRYDSHIAEKVWKWLIDNGFPDEVPHLNFDYHIYYIRFRPTSFGDDAVCGGGDF